MKRGLVQIASTEHQLVVWAVKEHGKYFEHAQFAIDFLSDFIKQTLPEGVFFHIFYATAEKHVILGALSGIRLHHVQANFNFRYATEAGS